jgi:tetratricopeptide (TPR) repeat protein
LAVAGLVLLAVALTLVLRRGRESAPESASADSQGAPPASEGSTATPPTDPDRSPVAAIPGPQAEAAALKREAVAVAGDVVEAYPDDAVSYALLGSAYYNIGQSEEASTNLQRCIELDPDQAEAYEILGRIAYDKGELEESVRLCQEGARRGPSNPEVLNRLGRSLLDLGRTEEAIGVLQQALELPRHTSQSCYLIGQAYLQTGDHARAKESFQRALALMPDHTQAAFGLFTACARLGESEEAARYREQFLKLEAVDRETLTDRSAQQDTLTGLPLVRKTVARTFFGAGQIYLLHKQSERAAELFLKVAELDADNAIARAALERLYVERGALAAGAQAFESLVVDQPDSGLNHLFLGRFRAQLRQFAEAERAYRKVQELSPHRPEGYRALAELYLRSNRHPAEARLLARKALELEPSGPNYYLLAFACAKNNDRAGALAAMEQAVALSPGNQRYQAFLRQLREAP